jgi:hypothetical protein
MEETKMEGIHGEVEVRVNGSEVEIDPKKFCPLCGKNRESQHFKPCVIAQTPQHLVKVNVCSSCNTVFFNARRIFTQVMGQIQRQESKLAREKAAIDKVARS